MSPAWKGTVKIVRGRWMEECFARRRKKRAPPFLCVCLLKVHIHCTSIAHPLHIHCTSIAHPTAQSGPVMPYTLYCATCIDPLRRDQSSVAVTKTSKGDFSLFLSMPLVCWCGCVRPLERHDMNSPGPPSLVRVRVLVLVLVRCSDRKCACRRKTARCRRRRRRRRRKKTTAETTTTLTRSRKTLPMPICHVV